MHICTRIVLYCLTTAYIALHQTASKSISASTHTPSPSSPVTSTPIPVPRCAQLLTPKTWPIGVVLDEGWMHRSLKRRSSPRCHGQTVRIPRSRVPPRMIAPTSSVACTLATHLDHLGPKVGDFQKKTTTPIASWEGSS